MGFIGDYRGSMNQTTGMLVDIPSGKLYKKLLKMAPVEIVDFPIKHGDFP